VVDIGAKLVGQGIDPDWTLVTREAKRQLLGELRELAMGYSKDEDLLEAFGEDIPKRMGRAMTARSSGVVGKARPRVEGSGSSREEPQKKSMESSAWIKEQRKKFEQG
jgi:hypothetical protein